MGLGNCRAITRPFHSVLHSIPPTSAGAVVLQLVDLREAHAQRRATSRSEAFHAWPNPLTSPAWHEILPHYRHLVIVPPQHCGRPPIEYEAPAFLAGFHGVTVNAGDVSRVDRARRRRYCERLEAEMVTGTVDDASLYLLDAPHAAVLKAAARRPVVCGILDAVIVCVTERSYNQWRHAARLQ